MLYILLALVSLLWGTSFVLVKIAAPSFDPTSIAAIRVLVAAAVLLPVVWLPRPLPPLERFPWRKLAALSLSGQILPFVMLGVAAQLTTSVDMALMMGAAPLVTLVLARFVPPALSWTTNVWIGVGIGFLGLVMMLAPNAEGLGINDLATWGGRVCALVAAGGYAAGALVSRSLSRDVDTTTAVALSMAMSAVILLPIWLTTRASLSWAQVESIPLAPIAALLLLGIMNTALAYVLYLRLIKLAGVTFAALNNYLVPVFGLFAGAAALGEGISPGSVVGLCLVLVGIAFVGTRQDRRA